MFKLDDMEELNFNAPIRRCPALFERSGVAVFCPAGTPVRRPRRTHKRNSQRKF
jgi:hypothetical protein